MARPADAVISDLQHQIADARPYISIAGAAGHGITVVLVVLPDGKLGNPKFSIDTRADKRYAGKN